MPANFHQLSREELYDKVWATPRTALAKEWGISDVAVSKHCKKLNVPQPTPGHWRKIETGQKPKRPPLPPASDIPAIKKDKGLEKPVPASLALPDEGEALLPRAADLLKAIMEGKPGTNQVVDVRNSQLPKVEVSQGVAVRTARAFHALLGEVESRGIPFRPGSHSWDGGHFAKGIRVIERVHLKIEENLLDKIDARGRNRSGSWAGNDYRLPGGSLTFTLKTERHDPWPEKQRQWSEDGKVPLETILAEMVGFIHAHYGEIHKQKEREAVEREKQRVADEKWRKEYEAKEIVRKQEEEKQRKEEARRNHAKKLSQIAEQRKEDFFRAAEWWRLHQSVAGFIAECEHRWRAAQTDQLTGEQEAWLAWARETDKTWSPFDAGYPDPAADGPFDPAQFPFGNPPPGNRDFPRLPSMPETPEPAVVKEKQVVYEPIREPYPFWLRNQGR